MNKLTFLIILHMFSVSYTMHFPIILLNGPAYVGKTSLATSLQETLGADFTIVSYDEFRKKALLESHTLPADYEFRDIISLLDDIKQITSLNAFNILCTDIFLSFYKSVSELSKTQGVIVDTVIETDLQHRMMQPLLDKAPLINVFVHASLNVISRRIQQRNYFSAEKYRYTNRTLAVYPLFYTTQKNKKNNSFSEMVSIKTINTIVDQSLNNIQHPGFFQGQELKKYLSDSFQMSDCNVFQEIRPLYPYHFVINTSYDAPQDCAIMLYDQLQTHEKFITRS